LLLGGENAEIVSVGDPLQRKDQLVLSDRIIAACDEHDARQHERVKLAHDLPLSLLDVF
jgi:hypothetical protein